MVRFDVHPGLPSGTHRNSDSSTVAIIPARYDSSRLPGKALADIAGRPMIAHVYERTASARSVGAVMVATDDERIRRVVEAFGGVARLTRLTHPSGTDRLAEVARDLECALVVNVQGDEPLIEPDMIEEALVPFRTDPELVMGTLCRRIDDPADLTSPDVVKVVTDRDGFALYFSRAPIPHRRAGGTEPPAFKHVGLYVYRREFLLKFAGLPPAPLERAEGLEQLRALEYGFRIKVVETGFDSIGVDTQDDLERVRRVAAARLQG